MTMFSTVLFVFFMTRLLKKWLHGGTNSAFGLQLKTLPPIIEDMDAA